MKKRMSLRFERLVFSFTVENAVTPKGHGAHKQARWSGELLRRPKPGWGGVAADAHASAACVPPLPATVGLLAYESVERERRGERATPSPTIDVTRAGTKHAAQASRRSPSVP